MASSIESIGFMHGLHNDPKLQIPGGGCGIHRTLVPPYPSRRGRFRPLRFMFYAMRHALCDLLPEGSTFLWMTTES